MAASDAKRRRIWFYEHADGIGGRGALPLFHHRVIVRVRRKSGGDGDVTIKLRGTDLVLPKTWSEPAEGDGWKFKIEGDWTGQRHSTAASLTVDVDDVDDAGGGAADLEALVTDRQVGFLHTSIELPIDMSVLEGLGPIDARTWSPTEVGFDEARRRRTVASRITRVPRALPARRCCRRHRRPGGLRPLPHRSRRDCVDHGGDQDGDRPASLTSAHG